MREDSFRPRPWQPPCPFMFRQARFSAGPAAPPSSGSGSSGLSSTASRARGPPGHVTRAYTPCGRRRRAPAGSESLPRLCQPAHSPAHWSCLRPRRRPTDHSALEANLSPNTLRQPHPRGPATTVTRTASHTFLLIQPSPSTRPSPARPPPQLTGPQAGTGSGRGGGDQTSEILMGRPESPALIEGVGGRREGGRCGAARNRGQRRAKTSPPS